MESRVKVSLREQSKAVVRDVTVELIDETSTDEELQRLKEKAREQTKDLYNSLDGYINMQNMKKTANQ